MRIPICDLRFAICTTALLALNACELSAETTNVSAYPIDLPTTLRLAGAQNLEIQIARQRLKQDEAERSSAIERFFPWIAPGVTYHRRDGVAQAVPAGDISDAHFQSYSPGVALTAQMDLGDALYNSLVAKKLVRASDHALEAQRQDTILIAAQRYLDLARSKALALVASDALKTSQDYQHQLQGAVEAGIAFKGDELRVQTQTKQFEILLRQALEQQRLTAVDLARILHLDPRVDLVPQDNGLNRLTLVETNLSLDTLIEHALASRPELKQSSAFLDAARDSRNGSVYGPLIPSISAQAFGGGLGGGADGGPSHFGAEGDYLVGLAWRIGPGGLFDPGRTHAAKARLRQAELTDSKLKDDVMSQVVGGLARVQSLGDQIDLAEAKLAAATETLRVTHERKQFGVGIVLEDVQAQQDLERARSDYLESVTEFNKAQYALSKAIGSVPPSSQDSKQAAQP
jgi:outer membrane protein TolC